MVEPSESSLEAPLLGARENGGTEEAGGRDCPAGRAGASCSNPGACCNLAVTAVGAGMLALPKAFATVGFLMGGLLFLLTCFLTYFSCSVIVRFACRYNKLNYGELIKERLGESGARLLQASIIVHVLGVMIVYLIICSDMLVGSAPDYLGMLPSILRRHDGPWFLSRAFVLGVLLLTTVSPMLLSRSLRVVAQYSQASVAMLLMLAAVLVGLAGVAIAEACTSPLDLALRTFTVLAVCALAFTVQFNLLPVQHSMRDSSTRNMLSVTKRSIALYATLYAAVASSGFILFGDRTDGDVLKSLTLHYLERLVPMHTAHALIYFIVLSTTFNLLVNFVLKVWAARDSVCQLCVGKPAAELATAPFYGLTFGLISVAYAVSIVLPSVWLLVSLIGSTACMTFSYVFPGLLMARESKSTAGRASGVGSILLAATLAGVAVFNTITGNFEM